MAQLSAKSIFPGRPVLPKVSFISFHSKVRLRVLGIVCAFFVRRGLGFIGEFEAQGPARNCLTVLGWAWWF